LDIVPLYWTEYWILSLLAVMLDIESWAVMLDIGYSPAVRDPALRDGLLDIESLAVMLDIGYSVQNFLT
jgi:hypothetical protein